MTLLHRFSEYIKEQDLFQKKDSLLIAVSGGVDSVVLCELCHRLKYNITIVHCNFQLREEESTGDETFVRELAAHYRVPILVKQFDTQQHLVAHKTSIQVAARELRYNWFNELLENGNNNASYRYLITAHHADDNIETMLMNFFKGTGIAGMRGMLAKTNKVIRPLLFASKSDITAFAKDNDLTFVEDSSNLSDKYTRNYFRNQLIPGVQKVFPGALENLAENIRRFSETEELFQFAMDHHKKKLVHQKGNEFHIPVLKLTKSSPVETITFEIIKAFGFTAHQTSEVLALLHSETGKYVQSASHRIFRNRSWLIIASSANIDSQTIIIEKKDKKLLFESGELEFKQVPIANYILSTAPDTAQLDAAQVQFPLLLRKRRQSDYFYPLGMHKKKKLNRFLSDLKLSITEKEQTWVMEMDKKIIWVTGKRIDDRFKVTPATKTVLQIRFIPGG